jgi:hypothetical protein
VIKIPMPAVIDKARTPALSIFLLRRKFMR